ncbi:hypothetical protein D3C74_283760 [compost metagenome]
MTICRDLGGTLEDIYLLTFTRAVIHPSNYSKLRDLLIKYLESTMWESSLRYISKDDPMILRNAVILGLLTTAESHCAAPWSYPVTGEGIDISGVSFNDTASSLFLSSMFGLLRLCGSGAQLHVRIGNKENTSFRFEKV